MKPPRLQLRIGSTKGGAAVGTGLKIITIGALAAGAVGAMVFFKRQDAANAVDERSCFTNRPPPAMALFALDTTDALAAQQPRLVQTVAEDLLKSLPEGGLLQVVAINGSVPAEIVPILSVCRPANNDNAGRKRYREHFELPLQQSIARLARRPPEPSSPIVETLVAIAGDAALREGGTLKVAMLTDALQQSALANFYTKPPRLPPPTGKPLANTEVRLVILRNGDMEAVQPAAAQSLQLWMSAAGAKVIYAPPPWMSVAGLGTPATAMEVTDAP